MNDAKEVLQPSDPLRILADVLAANGAPATSKLLARFGVDEVCAWSSSQRLLDGGDKIVWLALIADHLADHHRSYVAACASVAILELANAAVEHHNLRCEVTGQKALELPPNDKLVKYRAIRDKLAREQGIAPATSAWRELRLSDQDGLRANALLVRLRATGAVFVIQTGNAISPDLAAAIDAVADVQ